MLGGHDGEPQLDDYCRQQLSSSFRFFMYVLMATLLGVGDATTVWQFYNHCSAAFMQIQLRHANARAQQQSNCFTNFLMQMDSRGRIQLQNTLTAKFICFNKRRRLAIRADGSDEKCYFYEHLTGSGYIMFESAWRSNLFLGFNRRGKFQDPSQLALKRRCFQFTKLRHEVQMASLRICADLVQASQQQFSIEAQHQHQLYDVARQSLLSRIRAVPP